MFQVSISRLHSQIHEFVHQSDEVLHCLFPREHLLAHVNARHLPQHSLRALPRQPGSCAQLLAIVTLFHHHIFKFGRVRNLLVKLLRNALARLPSDFFIQDGSQLIKSVYQDCLSTVELRKFHLFLQTRLLGRDLVPDLLPLFDRQLFVLKLGFQVLNFLFTLQPVLLIFSQLAPALRL